MSGSSGFLRRVICLVLLVPLACDPFDSGMERPAQKHGQPPAVQTPGTASRPETSVQGNTPSHPGVPRARASLAGRFAYAGLPREGVGTLRVLTNEAFVVGYDEQHKNPAWVVYQVPGEVKFTEHTRPTHFEVDDRTQARVRHEDYTNSGFDRGHLAPSYAIYSRFGKSAQLETFLMSNVCPQFPNLNRGKWSDLEGKVGGRGPDSACWAKQYGPIWVTSGPIYATPITPLPAGIAVPSHFFTILLHEDEATGAIWMLAFIMPNDRKVPGRLEDYLASVDDVELQTRLDFFSELDDPLEDDLEMPRPTSLWAIGKN